MEEIPSVLQGGSGVAQLEALQGPWDLKLVSFLFLPQLPPATPEARGPSLPDVAPWLQPRALQTDTSIHLCLLTPQGLDRGLADFEEVKGAGPAFS